MRPDLGKFVSAGVLAFTSIVLFGCQQPLGASGTPVAAEGYTSLVHVYWVSPDGCRSDLRKVVDMTITSGDVSDLEFKIVRGLKVHPWQCPTATVPGAAIAVREKKPVAVPTPVTVSFIVHYETLDGLSTISRHTKQLILEPTGKKIE